MQGPYESITDRPGGGRGPAARDAGVLAESFLPQAVRAALLAASRRAGVSEEVALAVALQSLLYRYTRGDADLTVRLGLNRTLPGMVAGDRSFAEALHGATGQPAALVQRQLSGAPLTLTWADGAGIEVATVVTVEASGGLRTRFVVAATGETQGPAWQPAKLSAHWHTLVTGLANHPEQLLRELPLLDTAELALLTDVLSGAEVRALAEAAPNLVEVFERQAHRHPDRLAVLCETVELSYDELNRRANQLAAHLWARGVRRGDLVGLYLPRSADVFVALLAILKTGAGYVPIDPDYPEERVTYILQDAAARAVVTVTGLAAKAGLTQKVLLDADWHAIDAEPEAPLTTEPPGPKDLAYVIYTSGSTGKPKGVMIEHGAALAFLKADAAYYGLKADDRVYQGFSIAFDASVEEIWLAFHAGATLVVATAQVARSGPELATFLNGQGITVYSTVPTALMMIDDPLPAVRILILGGEACPPELVRRYARPGRRLVNSYGPTETTVVVTAAEAHPGRKVTIGRPLAGVRAYVLDESLKPAPFGIPGELCLAGPTLARGYLGRPEQTAAAFVPAPAVLGAAAGDRIYRTGDLVRYTANGELEFLGRIDSQVKLRGFRIELGEIEARLMAEPGVRNAAVVLREDTPGLKQLVAYVVPAAGARLDGPALRQSLRGKLPAYMVPAAFELLAELPALPSGKVDRKRLPAPAVRPADEPPATRGRPPATAAEAQILALWQRLFHPEPVGMDDDFFALGGHSLLASRMVSELRRTPRYMEASVLAVYQNPKLADFVKHVEERAHRPQFVTGDEGKGRFHDASRGVYARCVALQGLGLYLTFAVYSLNLLVPLLAFDYYQRNPDDLANAALFLFCLGYAVMPVHFLLSVALKWLIIGRFKAGSYPLWSVYYWRFWLAKRAMPLFAPSYLRGTPFLALYYRLIGAKIGKDVHLGTAGIVVSDLLTVGDGASIGVDSQLLGYAYRDGMLHIGSVTVGAGAVVGARCVLGPGSEVGAGTEVGAHSLVPDGQRLGANQHWQGSPAQQLPGLPPPAIGAQPQTPRGRPLSSAAYHLVFAVTILALTIVPLAAALPSLALWAMTTRIYGLWSGLALTPVCIALFVFSWCAAVALTKRLLVGKVQAGSHHMRSWYGIRRWCVDELLDASMDVVFPLFATLYLKPFLKALGVKVGKSAEVSTAAHFQPDLVELGDGSFLADAVCLGPTRVAHGIGTAGRVVVGKNAFIGNSAMIPEGTTLGEGALVGCQSRPPVDVARTAKPGSAWIGSPGVLLPRRMEAPEFAERYTFKPTKRLYAMRFAIEFWRITLPETLGFIFGVLAVRGGVELYRSLPLTLFLALLPLLTFGVGAAVALTVIALKWLIVGRYRPDARPLWSDFVWRTELVDALHEQLAGPAFLNAVKGTPLVPLYFRLMGTKIGKRALMESINISEFDLVTMGDDVCLDNECDLQTHLFEDRVMKMSTVTLHDKVTVGPSTVVLYDSTVGEGVSLSGMSLLMKGETLPPWTRWQGAPVVQKR